MEPRRTLRNRVALFGSALVVTAGLVGCGGQGPVGTSPAARVGDRTISVDRLNEHLTLDKAAYAAAEKNPQSGIEPGTSGQFFDSATIKSTPMRGVNLALTELVRHDVLAEIIENLGAKVTDADLSTARQTVESSGTLAGLPKEFIDFQVEMAAMSAVAEKAVKVSEKDLRAAYEKQKGDYTQVCMSVVAVDSASGAAAAAKRLEAGEPFDAVFAEANTDPQAAENNGDIGCTATADLEPTFGQAIYDAEADDLLPVTQVSEALWLVPLVTKIDAPSYDAIKEQLRQALAPAVTREKFDEVMKTVRINPRYGTWNIDTASVDAPAAPAASGDIPTPAEG